MARMFYGPKGMACRVDLRPTYKEGRKAFRLHQWNPNAEPKHSKNPYEYFGDKEEYCDHYAFDIGFQEARNHFNNMCELLWPASI